RPCFRQTSPMRVPQVCLQLNPIDAPGAPQEQAPTRLDWKSARSGEQDRIRRPKGRNWTIRCQPKTDLRSGTITTCNQQPESRSTKPGSEGNERASIAEVCRIGRRLYFKQGDY